MGVFKCESCKRHKDSSEVVYATFKNLTMQRLCKSCAVANMPAKLESRQSSAAGGAGGMMEEPSAPTRPPLHKKRGRPKRNW